MLCVLPKLHSPVLDAGYVCCVVASPAADRSKVMRHSLMSHGRRGRRAAHHIVANQKLVAVIAATAAALVASAVGGGTRARGPRRPPAASAGRRRSVRSEFLEPATVNGAEVRAGLAKVIGNRDGTRTARCLARSILWGSPLPLAFFEDGTRNALEPRKDGCGRYASFGQQSQ